MYRRSASAPPRGGGLPPIHSKSNFRVICFGFQFWLSDRGKGNYLHRTGRTD